MFTLNLYLVLSFLINPVNNISIEDLDISTIEQLESLVVTEENVSKYKREYFKHWIDEDKDCRNTRFEVLEAESKINVDQSSCSFKKGLWLSKYDGLVITDPSKIDIDHLIPLQEAWQSGANTWSNEKRTKFANDLSNSFSLIAVSKSSNRKKGSKEPMQWLPVKSYKCTYIQDWIKVKYQWRLSVDAKEKEYLKNFLVNC